MYKMDRRSYSTQKPRLIFLDIETTGLNPFNSNIIEIALKDNLGNSWETLIKSPIRISSKITDLTKITNDMLNKDGINIEVALNKMIEFIDGKNMNCNTAKWIIGHNLIGFDWAFIQHHCRLNKLQLPPYINLLDTYRMAQYLLRDEYQSYKLCNLCDQFKLEQNGFHRAMNDVCATHKLFDHFFSIFNSKNISIKRIWEITSTPFLG
jgi:DNA polymerase III alpha subunit (gram-positive type)